MSVRGGAGPLGVRVSALFPHTSTVHCGHWTSDFQASCHLFGDGLSGSRRHEVPCLHSRLRRWHYSRTAAFACPGAVTLPAAMRFVVDLVYLLFAILASPWWVVRMTIRSRLQTDWSARFGRGPDLPATDCPTILLHAVSVGEINAIRLLVKRLAADASAPRVVVATTTDTGFARASELYGDSLAVLRYPLDFSWSVRRFLDRVRPDAIALVELEIWPNFTAACEQRGIPVCVVNGRLSERSFRRYRLIRPFVRPSFARLSLAAVQSEAYGRRFVAMGVPADRVHITDTMKWDTAEITDDVPGSDALAEELGIDRSKPLVVAGSTAPEEHQMLVDAVPVGVQLLCAPRRPEWFDDAARVLAGCARRSSGQKGSAAGRFLLDTIGELRRAYALADVVVTGRSFGSLHGSDMIEPIALGKPVIVGPAVSDFHDTVQALLAGGGIIQTDRERLPGVLQELLDDPACRRKLSERGRAVVAAHQGATDRQAELVLGLLKR